MSLTKSSPHLYRPDEAPHYSRGLRSNLALFIAIIVLVGLGAVWIRILNRRHAATRERLGKSANVIDLSMESKRQAAAHEGAADDGPATVAGDKGFDDVTDLNNEDFIFLY